MFQKFGFSKYIAGAVVLFGLGQSLSSCRMDNADPIPLELEKGIYARQITSNQASGFNLALLTTTATFSLTLEIVGENNAANMQSCDFYVTFTDNSSSNGKVVRTEKLVKSIPASAFTPDATTKLPRSIINITGAEALAALSLSADSVFGGDNFTFRHAIKTTDGKVFTTTNTHFDLGDMGGFYKSPFRNILNVVCTSDLTAGGASRAYNTVAARGTSTDGCCVGEFTTSGKEITLTKLAGVGQYRMSDFSGGIYFIWYEEYGITPTNSPATLQDICNIAKIDGAEPFGAFLKTTSGSINTSTGRINYKWTNGWGDEGEVTLDPK